MPEQQRAAFLLRIRSALKDQLRDLAKREHRSLNQQIEFILEQFLSGTAKRASNPPQVEKHAKKTRTSDRHSK
jgi:hypothetical protein